MEFQNRIAERLNLKNSKWEEIPFEKLCDGDIFRLLQDDGAVTDKEGNSVWIARGEPYLSEENVLQIDYALE